MQNSVQLGVYEHGWSLIDKAWNHQLIEYLGSVYDTLLPICLCQILEILSRSPLSVSFVS
uniref:Uncharacterized protein n=1 Tax=Oryza brachyantha TaxID=4533 RepID=J3MJW8_ORYBR